MKIQHPLFIILCLLIGSCGGVSRISRTVTTYAATEKTAHDTILVYSVPIITPTSQTKQKQTKGGVVVSCEVVPFVIENAMTETESVSYARPNNTAFDVYEIAKIPSIKISPNEVNFIIRIRNNQDRVLKLVDVPIVYIADGIQYSIPEGFLKDWNNSLVVKGFEKEFPIIGPNTASLMNTKVLYISVNDVPISYDKAGNVTQKENFEWFFDCTLKQQSVTGQLSYTYEERPVHRERCVACSGVGHFESLVKCPTCQGVGKLVNKDGKSSNCYNCKGNGKVKKTDNCFSCGGQGEKVFPKSLPCPIASAVTWKGWKVEVLTNPPGIANIKVIDIQTRAYKDVGLSNQGKIEWMASTDPSPIIVEYQGKKVRVLPYDSKGNPSPKVEIDFLGASPDVRIGRKVN